jgi:hypothetical protein
MRNARRRIRGLVVLLAAVAVTGSVRADQQDPLPSARELVARHVKAIGGGAALAAVSSIRARGRFELPAQGIAGDVEILSARPAKLLVRVTLPALGRIENGFDGKAGWTLSPLTGPELIAGRQLAELTDDAVFDSHLHAEGRIREMTTLARTEFEGRPAYRVRVVFSSGYTTRDEGGREQFQHNEQIEYFDAERGWQIGSEGSRATPQGVVPMVNVLRDYKPFGALMQPTSFVQRALGFEQRLTMTSYEYDVVAANAFDMPGEIKALTAR